MQLTEDDVDLDGNYIEGEYIFVKRYAKDVLETESELPHIAAIAKAQKNLWRVND